MERIHFFDQILGSVYKHRSTVINTRVIALFRDTWDKSRLYIVKGVGALLSLLLRSRDYRNLF